MEEENKITIKRKRGRPRKADSQVSTAKARQIIKESRELLGKKPRRGRSPGSKDKKPRKRKTKSQIQAAKKRTAKKEETCGIKVVALIVKVDGSRRLKIKKSEPPKLAPCEELVCQITFEKDGIPVHSIFNEVRNFAEALAKCAGENLLHE